MHMHSALVVIDLEKHHHHQPPGQNKLKLSLLLRENLFSFKWLSFRWKTTCLLAAGHLFGDPWNVELWNCLLLPAYTLLVLFFTFNFPDCKLLTMVYFFNFIFLVAFLVACFSWSARNWPKVRIVCFDRVFLCERQQVWPIRRLFCREKIVQYR